MPRTAWNEDVVTYSTGDCIRPTRNLLAGSIVAVLWLSIGLQAQPWKMHVIDNGSQGADGTKIADINGDGLPDITTGWEEGGVIRVYLNPGKRKAAERWPAVTVGVAASPEDAVFVDLDGDGATDVVSLCEGKQRGVFVHWAPRAKDQLLRADAWRTEELPAASGLMQWMFAVPLQVDGKNGIDLIAAGKNKDAAIGWFEAPAEPRDLRGWKWHPLHGAGWVMSLVTEDMDGDGDLDVLASDRRGPTPRVFWLENPGNSAAAWRHHAIGGVPQHSRFLTVADLDGDGMKDVVTASADRKVLFHRRLSKNGLQWDNQAIETPATTGNPKSVAVGDINLDGKPDIVFSTESALGEKTGVMWLEAATWRPHDISGAPGTKYDLVLLIDLDGDGDLDVLTSEEVDQLGVVWYENPAK